MKTKKIKIAVLVSGGGTNLQALIDAQKSGILQSGKIALVLSNKANAFALQRAADAGIPTATVLKSVCLSQEQFENEIIRKIEEAGAELIVLAGFMAILSKNFTSHFERRILNVHPSLIQSFCGEGFYGLRVHEAALAKGVKVTGATVHLVNEVPDGGRILYQKAVPVRKNDTPEILQQRVMRQAEWILLPKAVETVSKAIVEGKDF